MSITIQNLIDTACLLAGDAGRKRDHDAELLIPRVLTWVGQRIAADPTRRHLLMGPANLALVVGAATLSDNVLVEYMQFATISDPADVTMSKKMRWIPEWKEFIRPLDPTLGYFTATFAGGSYLLQMTRPGTPYTPGSGMTGLITLTTPVRPAISGGSVLAPTEVEQEVVLALVAALRGDWQPNLAAEVTK